MAWKDLEFKFKCPTVARSSYAYILIIFYVHVIPSVRPIFLSLDLPNIFKMPE